MTWFIGKLRQISPTLTSLSSPAWATKITSASGQAAIPDSAPPVRGGRTLGISRARAARSRRPARSSRRMPSCHRPGVQLPPSGKITRAPSRPRPRARRSIWSTKTLSPARRREMKTLGRRLATTSTPGSSCMAAFMTTRGRRSYTLSRWRTSRNESPGPAWRLSTMTGRASRAACSSGVSSGSSTSTWIPNVVVAVRYTRSRYHRMTA